MTRKLYQLHQFGQKRLDYWYKYLNQDIPNSQILKYRDDADIAHKQQFRMLSKMPHNYFWVVLHLFIVIIGIAMLILTLIFT
jgi:hypothetical protein